MKVSQVQENEYASFYNTYILQVSDEYSLLEELEIAVHRFRNFVQNIPLDKYDYQYAEGKWTIKDIMQHLIDCERIFAYRALRFARKDATSLPGFDEDEFAANAGGSKRNVRDLLTELAVLRESNLCLFRTFSESDLLQKGVASGAEMSVRALGFVIIGHQNHHQRIFEERYL
ncbi:DinB family protein [Flavobacterium tegetincola]|uniref:DinB family protein n=1 Tax=Flavobacterium tegetincola TaxID=150172 RepID=UPI0003FDCB27|nr:DinB family protein [Flavobacterium tegetincola]